jgi:hypothetical protein
MMPKIVGVREWVYVGEKDIDTFVGERFNAERTSLEESPAEQGEAQGEAGARDPLVAQGGRADETRKHQEPQA